MIQYLTHPCSAGPSLNTCHRVQLDELLVISVLSIPKRSSYDSSTNDASIGLVKLGHPVPESNLSVDENSGVPSITST